MLIVFIMLVFLVVKDVVVMVIVAKLAYSVLNADEKIAVQPHSHEYIYALEVERQSQIENGQICDV